MGLLGSNNLESLLHPPITDKKDKNYNKNDAEKNKRLYYMFCSKLCEDTLMTINKIPKDTTTKRTIP